MKLEDWHTHNRLCRHAIGTLRDYILKAIEIGLTTIGFSDHFPYEFLKNLDNVPHEEYGMPMEELKDYFGEAEELRDEFSDKIEIRIGFELDYFIGQEDSQQEFIKKYEDKIDYLYGSIHVLEPKEGNWCLDDSRFMEEYNHYGVDNVYLQYYGKMQSLLKADNFDIDIIGHLDLPKKFKKLPIDKELVNKEVDKVLELVKKRNLVVEINTSGFRKEIEEQYPSEEIIRKLYQLKIPVVLGSDAHDPTEVGWEFERTLGILKEIGFTQLAHFNKRKRSSIDI